MCVRSNFGSSGLEDEVSLCRSECPRRPAVLAACSAHTATRFARRGAGSLVNGRHRNHLSVTLLAVVSVILNASCRRCTGLWCLTSHGWSCRVFFRECPRLFGCFWGSSSFHGCRTSHTPSESSSRTPALSAGERQVTREASNIFLGRCWKGWSKKQSSITIQRTGGGRRETPVPALGEIGRGRGERVNTGPGDRECWVFSDEPQTLA